MKKLLFKNITYIILVLTFISPSFLVCQTIDCSKVEIEEIEHNINTAEKILTAVYEARRENTSQMIPLAEELLCISEKIGYQEGIISAYAEMGFFYYIESEFITAIEYINKGLRIAKEHQIKFKIANCYNYLGLIYKDASQFGISLDYYTELEKLGKEENNLLWQSQSLGSIGDIHQKNGDYQKALEKKEEAIKIVIKYYKEIGDENSIWTNEEFGWGSSNIGFIYSKLKNYPKAREQFGIAERVWDTIELVRGQGFTYYHIGQMFFEQNELDSSSLYLNKVIEINKKVNNNFQKAETNYLLSKIKFKQEKVEEAISYCKKSVALADKNNLYDIGKKSSRALAEYYEKTGELRSEISALKKYDYFSENIYKKKEIAFDLWVDLKDKSTKTELAFQELEKKHIINLFLSSLAILVLLFFVLLYFYARKSVTKIKKINSKLQVTNQKLNNANFQLSEANDKINKQTQELESDLTEKMLIIANEKEMLEKLRNSINVTSMSPVEKRLILGMIKSHEKEDIWENINFQFAKTHEKFLTKLSEDYPSLNKGDLRLCIFLKMNLSSKEISRLTLRSTDSIKTARSRLRKKLSLSSQTKDIVTFLQTI